MVDETETFQPTRPLSGGLDDLRAFCAVIELGSLTAAARLLGETKGAISRKVQRLETQLGTRLLARSPRAVTPTEEGRRFHHSARDALAVLDDAADSARHTQHAVRGLIRLTAPVDFATHVLPPLLVAFQHQHPQVRLEVIGLDTTLDLTAHRLDLALRVSLGPLADLSYPVLPLREISLGLYAAPAYLEERGAPPTPEAVPAHALILGATFRGAARLALTREGITETIAVRASLMLSDFTGALRCAEAGGGIAPLPHLVAADAQRVGRLVPVLPEWSLGRGHLYALTQDGRDAPARVRALLTFLKAALV
ncbi:MAG: LysR family transcriptional regulator [Elstera sp.]